MLKTIVLILNLLILTTPTLRAQESPAVVAGEASIVGLPIRTEDGANIGVVASTRTFEGVEVLTAEVAYSRGLGIHLVMIPLDFTRREDDHIALTIPHSEVDEMEFHEDEL